MVLEVGAIELRTVWPKMVYVARAKFAHWVLKAFIVYGFFFNERKYWQIIIVQV